MLSPLRLKDKIFYGWVVVLSCLIIGTTIMGIRLSFGVFFKSIESEFTLSRAATSSIFSTYMIFGCLFAVLVGWTLDTYGPKIILLAMGLFSGAGLLLTSQTNSLWHLFITYSFLVSIGTNPIYVVVMSTVSRWFDRKRGLALGIASLGGGLAPIVMAPFATFLIANLDWRMAYVVIGIITLLIVIPLSRLLKKDPHEVGALPDGVKIHSSDIHLQKLKTKRNRLQPTALSLLQAFRTRSFWLIILIQLLFAACLFLVLTHLVPHTTDLGISAGEAAAVLSLMGGTTIAGRVLMGIASDKMSRKLSFIICTLLQAGAMVWLIYSRELWMFYLFALFFGFAWGGVSPNIAALMCDTFGLRQISTIMGVLDIGFGLGAAIGPVIGGLIFDINKSYSIAFLMGALAMLAATLLVALTRREMRGN